ncbi:MAG: hypothetical protein ACI9XZ_003722 [Alphaproteobacteria bacterium]|jgi:hypothetical protein
MGTTRNWIAATAAVIAMATPFIGSAEARPDRFRDGKQIELRGDNVQLIVNRRDGRRFNRRGSVRTPRIHRRIQNQLHRINRGRNTGRLSRFSSVRLRGRVFAIRSALRFSKLDGHVSGRERGRLMSMLDANSNRIRRHSRFGNGNRRFR